MKIRTTRLSLFVGPTVLATAITVIAGCSGNSKATLPPAPVTTSSAPFVTTYTTTFPLKEDPISEGGRWIGGKTVGIDWGNVSTKRALAIGHAGSRSFADSVALLTGNWEPNQTAEAVVEKLFVFRAPEVSLRLRSSLSAHRCTGYEVSYSLKGGDEAYLIIVRWNGPLADFTYLLNEHGKEYSVTSGDVVKATIAGNVITAYKNGVPLGQAKDNTYLTGEPGFGFNESKNGYYGVTRYTVTAANASQ